MTTVGVNFSNTGRMALRYVLFATCAAVTAAAGLDDEPQLSGAPRQVLDGNGWAATHSVNQTSIAAVVPGDLVTDLQRAGLMGDPLYGKNWKGKTPLWDTGNWTYSRVFDLTAAVAAAHDVRLVFDGVKMAATVRLNGAVVASLEDQFLRYSIPVTPLLLATGNLLEVIFTTSTDPRNANARFMGCSGGWDWAPYTETKTTTSASTWTKGIWKSVYLLPVPAGVLLEHVVPHVWYGGAYPTAPLTDATAGPWVVTVRAHFRTEAGPAPVAGTLSVVGSWAPAAPVSMPLSLPPGTNSSAALNLTVAAGVVSLWWPNGAGPRQLYSVTLTFTPSGGAPAVPIAATRRIGFRSFYTVTADDSLPANISGVDGSSDFTMRFKVNGADIWARGGNMIPMELLEGRQAAAAYTAQVQSAAAAHMNVLRIWGGGIYLPDAFYDACDEAGLLLYHDMAFAGDGRVNPYGNALEDSELRHQLRRLSAHPCIGQWDPCNECGGGGIWDSFVSTIIAQEDTSRPVWPANPSPGWATGVDMLTGFPNGKPLHMVGATTATAPAPRDAARRAGVLRRCAAFNCTMAVGLDYDKGPVDKTVQTASADACCVACEADPANCYAASWEAGSQTCYFKPDAGKPFAWSDTVTSVFPPGTVLPPLPRREFETHGPYQHGSGFPAVNGDAKLDLIDPLVPPPLSAATTRVGPHELGTFTSEFGMSNWQSFESMAATLPPSAWGIHGGAPPDDCSGGFTGQCTGDNLLAERNYPADSWIVTYSGAKAVDLNATGEAVFRGQLYLSMIGQALQVKSQIEIFRSQNKWGVITWQLGEVWPTGGWGSLEYGTVGYTDGQVLGGRWKPLHHWMADHLYRDTVAVCGVRGECFVRHDGTRGPFAGTAALALLHLGSGASSVVTSVPVSLPRGGGAISWFCAAGSGAPGACASYATLLTAAGCASNGSDCLLTVALTESGSGNVVDAHTVLLAVPSALALRPATLSVTIGDVSPDGSSVALTVASDAVALFVTLTTLAQGRFSTNAFVVAPSAPVQLDFLAIGAGPVDTETLTDTLAWEYVNKYVHT